jgi:hypothetical protein
MTRSNPRPSASAERSSPFPAVPAGRSRSRTSAVAPGAMVSRYQSAHLVPRWSGLTVGAPPITWSLMPSFGYGVAGAAPNRRLTLVSFSQNSGTGLLPSGPGPASSSREPRKGCSVLITESPDAASTGLGASASHDQVLRNQAVGSTCTVSVSGPALVTRTVRVPAEVPAMPL